MLTLRMTTFAWRVINHALPISIKDITLMNIFVNLFLGFASYLIILITLMSLKFVSNLIHKPLARNKISSQKGLQDRKIENEQRNNRI